MTRRPLDAMFARMPREGRVAPDLWMKNATGAPAGPSALLAVAEKALESVSAE